MSWSRRTTRAAIAGYLLVAALVVGGLTWATMASVRLEQSRNADARQAELRRRLALALARMEERVSAFMVRESRRSINDYEPFSYPDDLWSTDIFRHEPFAPIDQGEIAKRSELATTKFPEPWLLLHFSVSPTTDWSSPQVPTPDWLPPTDVIIDDWITLHDTSPRVLQMFSAMRRKYTPELLAGYIADSRRANPVLDDADSFPLDAMAAPGLDVNRRFVRAQERFREARAPEICDPRDLTIVFRASDGEHGEGVTAVADVLSLVASEFTGVWLAPDTGDDPMLAFIRTVVADDGRIAYQGFVLDWPILRDALLDEIHGLLPNARLEPAMGESAADLEAQMFSMPVRVVANAQHIEIASANEWTGFRSGLLLVWVAALTVLGAVGLGVHALLDLAERRRQFAYAVSHELRTPLTTFRLYTDMLATGMTPPEKRDEYIQTLNEESQRLADLVGGVLEYSRLEAQAPNLAVESVAVRDLMDAAKGRFEEVCQRHDRSLEMQTDEVGEIALHTDPDLVLQILGILVDNACKYAIEAEDKRIIIAASRLSADTLAIDVRDFGPGIARKNRRRIFQPFRRGVRGAQLGGIGLGLALARRWAALIGGKLSHMPNAAGECGARFRLALPQSSQTHKL